MNLNRQFSGGILTGLERTLANKMAQDQRHTQRMAQGMQHADASRRLWAAEGRAAEMHPLRMKLLESQILKNIGAGGSGTKRGTGQKEILSGTTSSEIETYRRLGADTAKELAGQFKTDYWDKLSHPAVTTAGGVVGGVGGMLTGATLGAAAGGIGAIPGAIIGGGLGAAGGSLIPALPDAVRDALYPKPDYHGAQIEFQKEGQRLLEMIRKRNPGNWTPEQERAALLEVWDQIVLDNPEMQEYLMGEYGKQLDDPRSAMTAFSNAFIGNPIPEVGANAGIDAAVNDFERQAQGAGGGGTVTPSAGSGVGGGMTIDPLRPAPRGIGAPAAAPAATPESVAEPNTGQTYEASPTGAPIPVGPRPSALDALIEEGLTPTSLGGQPQGYLREVEGLRDGVTGHLQEAGGLPDGVTGYLREAEQGEGFALPQSQTYVPSDTGAPIPVGPRSSIRPPVPVEGAGWGERIEGVIEGAADMVGGFGDWLTREGGEIDPLRPRPRGVEAPDAEIDWNAPPRVQTQVPPYARKFFEDGDPTRPIDNSPRPIISSKEQVTPIEPSEIEWRSRDIGPGRTYSPEEMRRGTDPSLIRGGMNPERTPAPTEPAETAPTIPSNPDDSFTTSRYDTFDTNVKTVVADYLRQDSVEGFRSTPYDDRGQMAIGYGFDMRRPEVKQVIGDRKAMTRAEANQVLSLVLDTTYNEAKSVFNNFDSYDQQRQFAIIELVYNLGLSRFEAFDQTIALIKQERWKEAASELLRSKAGRDPQLASRYRGIAQRLSRGGNPNRNDRWSIEDTRDAPSISSTSMQGGMRWQNAA